MKRHFLAAVLTLAGALATESFGQAQLPQWYLDAGLPALDTDGDGIPDAWELRTYGDPLVADSGLDRDGDGLTDLEEFAFGSDPRTFSTIGDGWSDKEKCDAGLDAVFRVTPAVSFAQWLAWLGWSAQDWQNLTSTNAEGFAGSYAGFVYNTAPYSDTNLHGTVDFWLVTRTDRSAWLTVGDALTTNSFPVRAGNSRIRLRAAYGGAVTLSLNPHPGTLAELPGATNGLWLCELSVEPFRFNTVVFSDGETPAVAGDPDSVDGLLLLTPPPAAAVHPLASAPPSVTLQPLRMTDGAVSIGGDGWYCLCYSEPSCDWPTYGLAGCDAVSLAMGGLGAGTPLISKAEARVLFDETYPAIQRTVPLTVANAVYPFIYGKVSFNVRGCNAQGGVFGAEQALPWHEPNHEEHSLCNGIGCVCDGGPHWIIGFGHGSVNTRNLTRINTGNLEADTVEHCLGVVWSPGGKTNLFSLIAGDDPSHRNELHFTTDNLTVNDGGELVFPKKAPNDLGPAIALVTLHYAPNPEFDQVLDRLWVVVNAPETATKFNNWYTQNADISWTTNLPSPFSSISFTNVAGIITPVDPESGAPNQWGTPHDINSYLHHDAQYEMRSNPVAGGHGHQATYNAAGSLIEDPIAAGTADLFAPYKANGKANWDSNHRNEDVYPFIRALQLDGNPVNKIGKILGVVDAPMNLDRPCIYKGSTTQKYVERRPVLP